MYCKNCNKEIIVPSPDGNLCLNCFEKLDIDYSNNNSNNNNDVNYINNFTEVGKKNEDSRKTDEHRDANFILLNYCKGILILSTIIGFCYSIFFIVDSYNDDRFIPLLIVIALPPFAYLILKLIESVFNIEIAITENKKEG